MKTDSTATNWKKVMIQAWLSLLLLFAFYLLSFGKPAFERQDPSFAPLKPHTESAKPLFPENAPFR